MLVPPFARGIMERNETVNGFSSSLVGRDKAVDYLLVIIGFGLCRAWIVFCLSASVASLDRSTDWIFLLAGAASALGVALTVARVSHSSSRLHDHMAAITTGLIIASIILVPVSSWLDSPPALVLGLVAGGAAAGLLQILWGERFAAQNMYFSLICAPAAAMVTGLLLSMSSPENNQIIFIALPLVSLFLLACEHRRCGLEWKTSLSFRMDQSSSIEVVSVAESTFQRPRLDGNTAKLMVSIMIFSFLIRTFDAFPIIGPDPLQMFGGSGSLGLVLVGSIFLALSFILKNRMNVSLVYRLSLPIMIAGFIIVAAFFGQRTPGSVLLIGIGYELFDILSWILFSYIAHKKGTSSTSYIFGFGVGFTFIGMAAGYILSSILGPLVAQGDVQISAVALVSVLCLAVVAFLVLPESVLSSIPAIQHSSKKVEEFSPVPEIEAQAECPPFDKACQAIATHYGLTPRESEVLEFLARGRTLPIVARDLQIAKNTARSHIEKIYQKLGVHKQQDLIDLVESWQSKEFPEKRQASL